MKSMRNTTTCYIAKDLLFVQEIDNNNNNNKGGNKKIKEKEKES